MSAIDKTRILSIDGRSLALGMEWVSLSGIPAQEREEVRRLAKEVGSEHYARSKSSGQDSLVGFAVKLDKSSARGKLHSAAQAFASMEGIARNAIFVWDLGNGKTWVCQSRNGLPVIDMDVVLDHEDAANLIDNTMSFDEDKKNPLTFYGNSTLFKSSSPLTLEDISESCGRDDEIRKLSSISISPASALAGLLILGVVAGGGWYYYEQQRIIAERKRQAEANKVDPNLAYQNALKTTNPGMPAAARWKRVRHYFDDLPTYVAGWQFSRAECKLSPEALCTITMQRIHGTNAELNRSGKVPEDVVWSADGATAQYTISLPEEKMEDAFDINQAPGMKSIMIDFVSKIQDASTIGLKISMQTAAPWAVPAGISFGDIRKDLLVSSGAWQAEGRYWMADITNELTPNFTINEMNVTYSGGNVDFVMKGNYYARN